MKYGGRRMEKLDEMRWSTVILVPNFWERLKFLFSWSPEVTFMWGQDMFRIMGVQGWSYWSVGGVPTKIRKEMEQENARQQETESDQPPGGTGDR